jgi:hypothetical protein
MHDPVPNVITLRARRVETLAEAEQLIAHIAQVLGSLLQIVEEETGLVRRGLVAQSAQLAPAKADLAGQYYAAVERLKANAPFLRAQLPAKLDQLRRLHDVFRPLLQLNLTVLATAHAVSEGIIRGVAGEVDAKLAPQVYGQSGRAVAPKPNTARPVALSRTS